ncbi:class IIb bacteriocin, lactobin A/cerein 7B family [Thalassotalea hakodatensis]|uniref:class IIb bacteriocin, lactobin A/cerein 7B family n=1 Tax=Thalassotalea hakodatensis TaxID=3030492 RepID=UPI002573F6BC|nr:class IIb bacteriocin, lactobin A/cerein 7B family [Thalassotalea hakodatensis]
MKELTNKEVKHVNGGVSKIEVINYLGDALTIGGGILAGAAYTASGLGVVTVAVVGSYYAGQAIGDWLFN